MALPKHRSRYSMSRLLRRVGWTAALWSLFHLSAAEAQEDVLYFSAQADGASTYALWSLDLETRELTQLTFPGSSINDYYPSLSPDGSELAFTRYDFSRAEVWVVPTAGGEAREVIGDSGNDYWFTAWSPLAAR